MNSEADTIASPTMTKPPRTVQSASPSARYARSSIGSLMPASVFGSIAEDCTPDEAFEADIHRLPQSIQRGLFCLATCNTRHVWLQTGRRLPHECHRCDGLCRGERDLRVPQVDRERAPLL